MSETISKLFSFVMLLVIMTMLFIWLAQQTVDLATFFGFRTSSTVANDLANFMTSASGVSGNVILFYKISPGSDSTKGDGEAQGTNEGYERNSVKYDIYFNPGVVCVTSYFIDAGRSSTDCAGHPFREISAPTGLTNQDNFCFRFEKKMEEFPVEGTEDKEKRAVMTVTEDSGGC